MLGQTESNLFTKFIEHRHLNLSLCIQFLIRARINCRGLLDICFYFL